MSSMVPCNRMHSFQHYCRLLRLYCASAAYRELIADWCWQDLVLCGHSTGTQDAVR